MENITLVRMQCTKGCYNKFYTIAYDSQNIWVFYGYLYGDSYKGDIYIYESGRVEEIMKKRILHNYEVLENSISKDFMVYHNKLQSLKSKIYGSTTETTLQRIIKNLIVEGRLTKTNMHTANHIYKCNLSFIKARGGL